LRYAGEQAAIRYAHCERVSSEDGAEPGLRGRFCHNSTSRQSSVECATGYVKAIDLTETFEPFFRVDVQLRKPPAHKKASG
jgi:hypothetical protein